MLKIFRSLIYHQFLFLVLFQLSQASFSQSINKAKLDSLFTALDKNHKLMGSISLFKAGKPIYERSIGYSFLSDTGKILATNTTKYRIGSVTKMFTAALVLQLVEENKLRLDTKLEKFFKRIPNAKIITVENLLNHRSGIHNFTDSSAIKKWEASGKSKEEMISIIASQKTDYLPGTKTSYSNSNYVLLGYIIEAVCKKPYATVLQERIISKASLNNTYYGGKTDIKNNESFSYKKEDKWVQEQEANLSVPAGAGAIISTPSDLNHFLFALFSGKIISPPSLQKMKTMVDEFGMGMFVFPFENRKSFGHNGGIDGFVSVTSYFPDDSIGIAFCTNYSSVNINSILIGVLQILYNKPYTIPGFISIKINPQILDKYIGLYTSSQLPIQIQISRVDSILRAQATGQPSINLDPVSENKFIFEPAGIELNFNLGKNEMVLLQGGGVFLFNK